MHPHLTLAATLLACAAPPPAAPAPPAPPAPESVDVGVVERPAPASEPDTTAGVTPAHAEGHLASPICVGAPPAKDQRPHRASCCYPSRELMVRPMRSAFPALRACYEARKHAEATGRMVFAFRIEQDGSIGRVCSGEGTTFDDEGAVRCMLEVVRKVRYPAMDEAERDLCGLISLQYPVTFAAEP